ncbi:hypothetical protein PR048_003883 [Dryococelus australis]|uniref:Uncharacterized protein n=1 Tax=Dryococelus australis TaxID=614101 RepID=A0ABQ9IQU7_9NEOP|nr:hypothetical protein PR048_003883 [Dryococelus australis]
MARCAVVQWRCSWRPASWGELGGKWRVIWLRFPLGRYAKSYADWRESTLLTCPQRQALGLECMVALVDLMVSDFLFGYIGSVAADWLDCSPPTKANRVQSPAGPLPDFRKWESCWTMPFLGDLPPPNHPPLQSDAAPFSPHFTLIGSQDLVVKSRPKLSTQLNISENPLNKLSHLVYGRGGVACEKCLWSVRLKERTFCLIGYHMLQMVRYWLSCQLECKLGGSDWRKGIRRVADHCSHFDCVCGRNKRLFHLCTLTCSVARPSQRANVFWRCELGKAGFTRCIMDFAKHFDRNLHRLASHFVQDVPRTQTCERNSRARSASRASLALISHHVKPAEARNELAHADVTSSWTSCEATDEDGKGIVGDRRGATSVALPFPAELREELENAFSSCVYVVSVGEGGGLWLASAQSRQVHKDEMARRLLLCGCTQSLIGCAKLWSGYCVLRKVSPIGWAAGNLVGYLLLIGERHCDISQASDSVLLGERLDLSGREFFYSRTAEWKKRDGTEIAAGGPDAASSRSSLQNLRPTVSTLASHQGEPGSIPGRVTGFSRVGIVPDDAVGQRISHFLRPFIPVPLHTHFNHPRSLVRTAQISSLTPRLVYSITRQFRTNLVVDANVIRVCQPITDVQCLAQPLADWLVGSANRSRIMPSQASNMAISNQRLTAAKALAARTVERSGRHYSSLLRMTCGVAVARETKMTSRSIRRRRSTRNPFSPSPSFSPPRTPLPARSSQSVETWKFLGFIWQHTRLHSRLYTSALPSCSLIDAPKIKPHDQEYTSRPGICLTTRNIHHDKEYTSRPGIYLMTRNIPHDQEYTSRPVIYLPTRNIHHCQEYTSLPGIYLTTRNIHHGQEYTSRTGIYLTTRNIPHDQEYTSRPGLYITTRNIPHDQEYTSRPGIYLTTSNIPHDQEYTSLPGIYITARNIPHDQEYTSRPGIYLTDRNIPHDQEYTSRTGIYLTTRNIHHTWKFSARPLRQFGQFSATAN